MMKKLTMIMLTAVAALSLTVLPGTLAEAGHKCKKCDTAQKSKIDKLKGKAKMLWLHKDELGLTKEQMSQLKEIKHSAIKDIIRLQADVDVAKVDIDGEMWSEQIDTAKVNRLIDTKYGAKTNIAKTYVKALADMQKVLSEEQRGAWLQMRAWKKMNKSDCGKCDKSGCSDCAKKGGKCDKCSKGKPGFCPITGKPLSGDKGSMKGSM